MDQETNDRLHAIEHQLLEIRRALLGALPVGGGLLSEHASCRAEVKRLMEQNDQASQSYIDIHDLKQTVHVLQSELEETRKVVDSLAGIRVSIIGWCAGATFAVSVCWTLFQALFLK